MVTYKSFQVQLTSIMEALTRAAVTEICGLLDQSCAVLQLEVRRSHSENEALRRKLQLMEGTRDLAAGNTSQHDESGRGPGPETSVIGAAAEERLQEETQQCPERGVVVIKKEVMTEESSVDQDGLEARWIKAERDSGPTMTMPSTSADQWDTLPEQVQSQGSSGLTCPAGGADDVSPNIQFDYTADSGGEGSSGAVRETFGSEQAPDDTLNGTIVYEDPVTTWPSPGQFSILPASLRQNLKPDHYLSDRVLGMGTSGLAVVDLESYCRDRRFVCRLCGKRFTSSRLLKRHARMHTGERPYGCAQCGKRFTQSGHLKTHQSVHRGNTSQHDESGQGPGPETSVTGAAAEERLREETQQCPERGVVVIKKEVMTEELSVDQDGLEARWIKDERDSGPTMTMPSTSADQWDTSPDRPAGGAVDVSSKVQFDYTADSGGEGSSGALRETFESEQAPNDKLNSTIVYEDPVSTWASPNQFSLLTASLRQYQKPDHYLTDRVLGIGASGLAVMDLDRYCRDRRFVCRLCGKRFTSSRILETHMRVHTGERPYGCTQCGKRFTQSGHLKTHQNVHTGERPYACQSCGKRFAGKQNLRLHQKKHHPAEAGSI